MDKNRTYARQLVAKMTLREKIAQVSQTVAGYRCFERKGEDFSFNDEFRDFIRDWGAMGAISNILRADPFTAHGWGQGIEPRHRVKVANQLQKYAIENSRLGIPVLIEVESNHGLQALGSEMFPTNLGMGCMFNPELYGKVLETVGKEIELSANQMGFVTMLDMARDPRWGRTEEFFTEDPYLAGRYAEAGVKGFKQSNALVCCKHFCATGDGFGGLNTAEVNVGERELHEIHLVGAEKAVKAGADVFMAAYNTVDGIPCHANHHILTDILRDELGFEGIVLSDGFGTERAIGQMGYAPDKGAAAILRAGVDLSLADKGAFLHLEEAVEKGLLDVERLDEAVTRIIEKKYALGLFDNPYREDDGSLVAYLDSGVQKRLAYEAATESAVLLKNNGVLPVKKEIKAALFGCHADNIYYLLGDYSSLQKEGETYTLRDAFKDTFASTEYTHGWDFHGNKDDFKKAIKIAKKSDVIFVTLGGNSSSVLAKAAFDSQTGASIQSEFFHDCGEGCDVSDIALPGNQTEFVRMLKEKTGKPVVAILVQGRPYQITAVNEVADAVLAVWYPGHEGPRAVCDLLTGKVNPSGKLSVSIPYASTCLPAYYNRYEKIPRTLRRASYNNTYQDCLQRILYPFGYGLSYAKFGYRDLSVTKEGDNRFLVEATVENLSDIPGKEAVQLYIHGSDNSVRRRDKELRGVCKVELGAHEAKKVTFALGYDELKIWSVNGKYEVEPGTVEIMVGSNPDLPLRATICTK